MADWYPHEQPHVSFERFRVKVPGLAAFKGMDLETAKEISDELDGLVERSTVFVITGGPDIGTEILSGWKRVYPRTHVHVVDTATTTEGLL